MVRSSARIASKVVVKSEPNDEESLTSKEVKTSVKKKTPIGKSARRTSVVDETSTSIGPSYSSSIDEDSLDSVEDEVDNKKSAKKTPRGRNKANMSCISNSALPSPRQPIDELNSARLKLETALAYAARAEEYDHDSDEDEEMNENDRTSPHKVKHHRVNSAKKDKKNTIEETVHTAKPTSLVLKLFDRSVDLSKRQFTKFSYGEIPLYPVCCEWMRNGREPIDLSLMEREEEEINKTQGISNLPQPIAKSKDENGTEVDLRIPPSVTKPTTGSDEIDNRINSLDEKDQATLLTQNVHRWRQIRSEWRQAAMQNEARYRHSCNVLKQMYDKSMSQPLIEPKVEPMDSY